MSYLHAGLIGVLLVGPYCIWVASMGRSYEAPITFVHAFFAYLLGCALSFLFASTYNLILMLC